MERSAETGWENVRPVAEALGAPEDDVLRALGGGWERCEVGGDAWPAAGGLLRLITTTAIRLGVHRARVQRQAADQLAQQVQSLLSLRDRAVAATAV